MPQRYILAVLMFLVYLNQILTTNCFSLALTQMVMHETQSDNKSSDSCPVNIHISSPQNDSSIDEYDVNEVGSAEYHDSMY